MKKLIHKRGFTLVELLSVVLILGILITIGVTTISSAINNTKETKIKADFKELETAITYCINSNPQLTRKTGTQIQEVLKAYNEYAESELKIDLAHTGNEVVLTEGGGTYTRLSEIGSSDVVGLHYIDPWGTPYKLYVQGDNLALTGNNGPDAAMPDAELRIFAISNGPNTSGGITTNTVDIDDRVLLVEYINGDVRIGYYNVEATDTSLIKWFSTDFYGYDHEKAINTSKLTADTILNMNTACLAPLTA